MLTAATAAASPVVSAFLAIVFAAWFLVSRGRDREHAAALVALAVVPVAVVTLLYPQGGTFPFRFGALVLTVLVSNLLDAPFPVIMAVFAEETYGSATDLGLMYGTLGGAALVGALVYSAVGHRLPRRRTFVCCFALFPLSYLTIATTPSLPVALAALESSTDAEALFAAANCEQDWQAELWGWDSMAQDARAARLKAFRAAAEFARLANR